MPLCMWRLTTGSLSPGFRHPYGGPASAASPRTSTFRPADEGIITNRNKFVLGPERQREVVFMNHLTEANTKGVRTWCWWDTGNSYRGLCAMMIRRKTNGQDGTTSPTRRRSPSLFNPFYTGRRGVRRGEEGQYQDTAADAWKSARTSPATKTESGELGSAVNAYILKIQQTGASFPSFNTFYE